MKKTIIAFLLMTAIPSLKNPAQTIETLMEELPYRRKCSGVDFSSGSVVTGRQPFAFSNCQTQEKSYVMSFLRQCFIPKKWY